MKQPFAVLSNAVANVKQIASTAGSPRLFVLSECPGLPMEINNKVWRWKDLEGFVMLGKDESLLYDDELFVIMTNNGL